MRAPEVSAPLVAHTAQKNVNTHTDTHTRTGTQAHWGIIE